MDDLEAERDSTFDVFDIIGALGEPSVLLELPIAWKVPLCSIAEDPSILYCSRSIVELSIVLKRKAYEGEDVTTLCS